jgi:hypothetical protein
VRSSRFRVHVLVLDACFWHRSCNTYSTESIIWRSRRLPSLLDDTGQCLVQPVRGAWERLRQHESKERGKGTKEICGNEPGVLFVGIARRLHTRSLRASDRKHLRASVCWESPLFLQSIQLYQKATIFLCGIALTTVVVNVIGCAVVLLGLG